MIGDELGSCGDRSRYITGDRRPYVVRSHTHQWSYGCDSTRMAGERHLHICTDTDTVTYTMESN